MIRRGQPSKQSANPKKVTPMFPLVGIPSTSQVTGDTFTLGTKDNAGNFQNGSWRMTIRGQNLIFQRLDSGVWTDQNTIG